VTAHNQEEVVPEDHKVLGEPNVEMVGEDAEEELSNEKEPDKEELSMLESSPLDSRALEEHNVDPSHQHASQELAETLDGIDGDSP
jgi:hypothetical protein